MLTLSWPWLFILLPLPAIYRWWAKPANTGTAALQARHYAQLTAGFSKPTNPVRNRGRLALLTVVWLALLAAAARPTWVGEPITLSASGRDLMLAVDISDSMRINDMQAGDEWLSRITVLRQVVGEFINRRQGDRLGLIVFGSQAYLQAPLTFDLRTVATLLDETQIGFAGLSTAIGDAIVIAIKRLEAHAESNKVIVLLSDGADTSSEIPPLKAAELARLQGVRIHTIGLGAGELIRGGRRVNPSWDLDEKSLEGIAKMTGGQYFRARDPADLAEIYAVINRIEPAAQEGETLRPRRDLFYWPLAIALVAWVLLMLQRLWRGTHE